jgi:hypothetical protein
MGQAKLRGTYEQRKAAAEERRREADKLKAEVVRRKPSPKHLALMAVLLAGQASKIV